MKTTEIKEQVVSGKYDALIEDLYADPSLLDYQKQRYAAALDKYQTLFGDDEVSIYSAAGRSEISGNHTDHQHGCVLAGSINLDAIGIVSKQDHVIKVISDDFDIKPIDLNDLVRWCARGRRAPGGTPAGSGRSARGTGGRNSWCSRSPPA